ncbi:hypothetical protein [Pedobacter gandavensis]|uniref:hypothetical protein n=1 Tax=Pedobacter gandavensis TaxID=2679963 RepID=UPI00292FD647|nr:hypothetical protein [Pedobacter gandavensis]
MIQISVTALYRPLQTIAKTKEDSIPEYWEENWKKRFEEGRKKGGEYSISGIF